MAESTNMIDIETIIHIQNQRMIDIETMIGNQNQKMINIQNKTAEIKKQNDIHDAILADLTKKMVKINKIDNETLFYKFNTAFQDLNTKYHLDESPDSILNSIDYKRETVGIQGHYLYQEGNKFDDTEAIIYDKIQLLRSKLLELSDTDITNFENIFGDGLIKEMLGHLDRILQNPKPDGIISDNKKNLYINWFGA
jgi:uncharacterized coiled-coil protein SlyX